MKNVIVSTSAKTIPEQITYAKELARQLSLSYVERKKQSIEKLLGQTEGVLLVYKEKLVFVQADGRTFSFHPDTAMLRIKAPHDALLDLIGKPNKRILDCTMGLASDSLVMASAGNQVTAVEESPLIHLIVSQGLAALATSDSPLALAAQSIETVCGDSLAFLEHQADDSFDIVYFDPMFSETIQESKNLDSLSALANPSRLTEKMLSQAKRVAKEAIVIKAHFRDTVFEEFDFERQVRPNQKFHYGIVYL